MKKTVRRCLIGAGIIALLCFCAPLGMQLLIGVMYAVHAPLHYNADPPHKIATLVVPNSDIAVTLWVKQQSRAMSYEGEYRVVEVVEKGQASQFYQILSASAGDHPKLAMYWHPAERILRFVDDGLADGPEESSVDLNAGTVIDSWRRPSGETFLTNPRKASAAFCFPAAGDDAAHEFTTRNPPSPPKDGSLIGLLENSEPERKQDSPGPSLH